jgi:Family of unknown function (DUF6178)
MAKLLLRRTLDGALLGQMLEDPQLAPQLRALPAPLLRQVILQIGLEDAGELVALSSLEQLREVFDEDLWQSPRPGQDDAFDAARFCTWLEVLGEAGDAFVADRLAELSEDFLVFAFSRLLRALDAAEVAASITDDEAGLIDKVLEAEGCQELGDYLIASRIESGWDALWNTLLALDDRHPELLRGVLHRCWLATREQAEGAGGLYEVLTGEEQLLEDARAEREERRAARGYVSPADARAFLGLARRAPAKPETDPITRAYFRELQPAPAAPGAAGGGAPSRAAPLRRLLAEAGVEPASEDALACEGTLFRSSVAELAVSEPGAHQQVVEELAYLANALVAGDTERAWQPVEAAERVLELCDEGLRAVLAREGDGAPDAAREALVRWGAVGLFRTGWAARRPA